MRDYNGFSGTMRKRAQAWLNEQWKAGTLARPTECEACGQKAGIIDAHAEDYSLPFKAGKTDEYHLCFRCHMMVHCRHRMDERWQWYKAQLMAGVRFMPFHTRNYFGFLAQMARTDPPVQLTGPPRADVLGQIDKGESHDDEPGGIAAKTSPLSRETTMTNMTISNASRDLDPVTRYRQMREELNAGGSSQEEFTAATREFDAWQPQTALDFVNKYVAMYEQDVDIGDDIAGLLLRQARQLLGAA